MQILISLTLFVFLVLSPENSWAEKIYRVVVFGDSLTSGYQLQPQDAFAGRLEAKLRAMGYDKIEVINMGHNGASSASATAETEAVKSKRPDVVIVELGFNDVKRGVLASAIANNLNTITNDLKQSGAYIIFMGITLPAGTEPDYANEITGYFSSLSSARGLAFYPSTLDGIINNPSLTLADGMHPNTAGVDVMVDGMLPLVDAGLRWRYEVFIHEMEQAEKTNRAGALVPTFQ